MNSEVTPIKKENEHSLPKISIVTPSFQQGEFIEETILSVISQNYPDIEYIIIDGGSTDQTVEIIKQFENKISYWVSEPDNGQTHALNKGFRLARGDILAYINSDDLLSQGSLRIVGEYFREHPEVQIIYGNAIAINRRGFFLYDCKPGPFDLFWLIRTDYIPQTSVFFRRGLLEEIGYLDERLQYAMDYDLLLKTGLKTHLIYIPEILSKFRVYPEAKTSEGKFPFSLDIIYCIDRILQIGPYSEEISSTLMRTLFWRILEVCLEIDVDGVKNGQFRNDEDAFQKAIQYTDLMNSLYQSINSGFFRYNEVIENGFDILINKINRKTLRTDALKVHWIEIQLLDSLIFSFKLAKKKSLFSGIRMAIVTLLFKPSIILDLNTYKFILRCFG